MSTITATTTPIPSVRLLVSTAFSRHRPAERATCRPSARAGGAVARVSASSPLAPWK